MRAVTSPHDQAPFAWQSLQRRVHDHLMGEGIPHAEAARLSREIIVICANDADSIDREDLHERAFDEARTLLHTWQATRREQLLEAI
ncbi:MAG: hypothetical protein ACJ8H8_13290 [Geminicoccaceae bacterium]